MKNFIYENQGRMAFAILCDGMGGLAKGEVASASVIRAFDNWIYNELPNLCKAPIEDSVIRQQWEKIVTEQNEKIKTYGGRQGVKLGTTVVAMLLASNDKYYKQSRTATITVEEHNFDAKDIVPVFNITRALDANEIEDYVAKLQDNSKWTTDGDIHTITIEFKEDADYQWTLDYTDLSGRKAVQYASEAFVIDNVDPVINVTYDNNDVANRKYYKAAREATITITEHNFRVEDVVAVVTATRELESNGKLDDCTVKDYANNEYSLIGLDDGREYETVEFSINRDGSIFAITDENTEKVVEKYYVYSVEKDIVLEEISVDPVEMYVVKLNGKELEEGKDYSTKLSGGDNEWSKRTYSIHKELFAAEGEYSIVVESIDKAGTTAYSDVKDLKVAFVVDQTKPVLTISGLQTLFR